MAKLRIPEDARNGFLALSRLSDPDFTALVHAAQVAAPTVTPKLLADHLAGSISSTDPAGIRMIMGAVLSLNTGRIALGVRLEQLLHDLAETLYATKNPPAIAEQTFIERVEALLNVETLRLSGRAWGLLTENQRNFVDSRIVTDIRPVFGDDEPPRPQAAIVVHSLKIIFIEDGETREFFVSLDSKDLQEMIDVLRRAQSKAEGLKPLLEGTYLPRHEIEGR